MTLKYNSHWVDGDNRDRPLVFKQAGVWSVMDASQPVSNSSSINVVRFHNLTPSILPMSLKIRFDKVLGTEWLLQTSGSHISAKLPSVEIQFTFRTTFDNWFQ